MKTVTIEMTKVKDCKGSVRYGTKDPKAAVSDVYVQRDFDATMPTVIDVTITAKG